MQKQVEVFRSQQQSRLSLEPDVQADSTSKDTVPRINLDQDASAVRQVKVQTSPELVYYAQGSSAKRQDRTIYGVKGEERDVAVQEDCPLYTPS